VSSSFLKATGLCRARLQCSHRKIIEADSGAAPGAPLVPSVSHRLPRRAGASDPRARPRTPGDVAAAGGEPRATPARVRAEGVVGRGAAPEPDRGEPPLRALHRLLRPRLARGRLAREREGAPARGGDARPRRGRSRARPGRGGRVREARRRRRRAARAAPAPRLRLHGRTRRRRCRRADDSVGARPRHRVHVRRRRLTSPGPSAFARRPAAATHGGRRPGVLLSSVLLILRTDDETIAKSRISASRRPVGRRRSREGEGAAGPSGGPHGRARRAGGRRARERDRDGAVVGAEPARARSRGDWSGAQRRVGAFGGWEAGGGV
jgi:hypothetical protein